MGKASTRAQNRYIAKAYDRVNLTLPKCQKKVAQTHAAARGESVNGFIGRAISETMERDSGGDTSISPVEATEAAGEAVPEFITRAVETQAKRDKVTRGLKA